MAYCTETDLTNAKSEEILKQLASKTVNNVVKIDSDLITAAIKAADGIIDFYCNRQYTVPFTAPVPQMILNMSVQLTICRLYRRSNRQNEDEAEACKEVMEKLKEIAEGEKDIPGVSKISSDVTVTNLEGYDEDLHTMDSLESGVADEDED